MYCANCEKRVPVRQDPDTGSLSCEPCGKVLQSENFSEEPTFRETRDGQSVPNGCYVSLQSEVSASRQTLMENARKELRCLRNGLNMGENEQLIDIALRFYRMALDKKFTRGRSTDRVLAACLYIACRAKKKPYLLIEFSNLLKIDVYLLGDVFMQLCKVLHLDEYPLVKKPVDPSIYIPKFTESLLGRSPKGVIQTAVRIITSMKRDWMQTGRKPSGLCGAALYISALSHGHKCSRADFLRIAHVCDATLTKRLIEFENTESGRLTIEEFNLKENELDEAPEEPNEAVKQDKTNDILCEHKDSGKPFAHGLCKFCYDDLLGISGGLQGGSNPPAFQRAEIERRKQVPSHKTVRDYDVGASTVNAAIHADGEVCDQSDNLSDIDDVEVDEYLLDEEGKRNKKIIWEALNREYIEEQAAKAAMRSECPESEATAAKKRKERQQARAAKERDSTPAQTAAEAAYKTLTKKRLGSKINFDVLENMFETSDITDVSKKSRIDSHFDNNDDRPYRENEDLENNGNDYDNFDEAYNDEANNYGEDYGYDYSADYGDDDYM